MSCSGEVVRTYRMRHYFHLKSRLTLSSRELKMKWSLGCSGEHVACGNRHGSFLAGNYGAVYATAPRMKKASYDLDASLQVSLCRLSELFCTTSLITSHIPDGHPRGDTLHRPNPPTKIEREIHHISAHFAQTLPIKTKVQLATRFARRM